MNPPTAHTPHPAAESLLAICHFAAFSDGEKSDSERARLDSLARELGNLEGAAISRRLLMGKLSLEEATTALSSREDRLLAYEMARAVCEASGALSRDEREFLAALRSRLALPDTDARTVDHEVDTVALAPLESPGPIVPDADLKAMVLRYAVLNGALELLPQTLATMAILPLQMKMVWRIGKAHGQDLDRSSIKEFLAAAGLGFGSQMLEGFARKLIGGFGRNLGGKLVGRVAGQATGSAFSFASTYAIGHLAIHYHASGRKFGVPGLKALYTPLTNEATQLHSQYLPEIQERARSLDSSSIMGFLSGKTTV